MANSTQTKREKRPPRTIKEKKFVKEYIKSGNGTEAALNSYDTTNPKTAAVIATQNLIKLNISDLMDKRGLTDDKLLEVLDDGLRAMKVISANVINIKSNDPTVMDQKANSMTRDFIDVEDHPTRHRYLETALRLKGYNMGEGINVNIQNNVIQSPAKRPLDTPPKTD